jgi:hypothetical protein
MFCELHKTLAVTGPDLGHMKHRNHLTNKQTNKQTISVEQSPSLRANTYPATQQIIGILQNPTVHYHVNNSPLLVPILSQMNPVHTLPSSFFKIHFNVILSLMPRSYTRTSSFTFLYPNSAFPFSIICTTYPAHHILLHLIILIIL